MWVWKETGKTLHLAWQAHSDIIQALAFSSDGSCLASGSYDGKVKLWDVESGALLWSGGHTNTITAVAFAPDGSLLASGGIETAVRLWDTHNGTLIATLSHPTPVYALTWSPDGHLLVSATSYRHIRLWKRQYPAHMTCMAVLTGHNDLMWGLAFAPGSRLASGSWDHTVKLWEVSGGSVLQTLTEHTDRVQKGPGVRVARYWSEGAAMGGFAGGISSARSAYKYGERIRERRSASRSVPMAADWPVAVTMGSLHSGIS